LTSALFHISRGADYLICYFYFSSSVREYLGKIIVLQTLDNNKRQLHKKEKKNLKKKIVLRMKRESVCVCERDKERERVRERKSKRNENERVKASH
jgi:hypothetical protein